MVALKFSKIGLCMSEIWVFKVSIILVTSKCFYVTKASNSMQNCDLDYADFSTLFFQCKFLKLLAFLLSGS
jgi:hypothetical protein